METVYKIDSEKRERLEQQLATELGRDEDVVFAYLYGSFAEMQPFHDIDVGVYLDTKDQGRLAGKALDIAQCLTERLGFPADVRPLNAAPATFLHHVLRGTLILSRDDRLLEQVIEDTIRRYLDIAPLLRHSTKEAFVA